MPEPYECRHMDETAGKKEMAPKRRSAGVNGEPFPHEAQVLPLPGQQTALGKFDARDCHAWEFLGRQFLFDVRVEFGWINGESLGGVYPAVQYLAAFVLEPENEIQNWAHEFAFFWLVAGGIHADYLKFSIA